MDIHHLRYLTVIWQAGSITQAAKKLYMSQPNLSRAVKEIELETGFPVFRRTPHGVAPTSQGLPLLHYAQKILSQMDEMEKLYKPAHEDILPLQVCVPPAPGFLLGFGDCLAKLPRAENFSVSFVEASGLEAVSHVAEGPSSIGILRYPQSQREYFENALEDAGLVWEPLWEFDRCLIFSTEHPLAARTEVFCCLLNGYTEIICGEFGDPGEDRKGCRKIYANSWGAQYGLLRRMPHTYIWGAPFPLETLPAYGIVWKPCPDKKSRWRDILIHPKNQVLTGWEREFLTAMKKYCILPQS